MFEFFIKNIPTTFVKIRDKELKANEVASTLEMFIDEDEINNYYLNTEVADVLIEEGVLIKKAGSRMAELYCKTEEFDAYYDKFIKDYYNRLKENEE